MASADRKMRRAQPPGGNRPPSHVELQRLVIECEPLMARRWEMGHNDGDMMILADLNRKECVEAALEQWDQAEVDRVLNEARGTVRRPMIAYLASHDFPNVLPKSGDFAHKEAAKELKGFQRLAGIGIVPLLVLLPGGLWATSWAKPGGKTVVVRYEPETAADAN